MQRVFLHLLAVVAFLSAGWDGPAAQVRGDTTRVDDREFFRLLRQSEELNKEQKWRARRTKNARVLLRLAGDEDPSVRFYVAFNPYTPAPSLLELAADPNQTVRWAVGMNTRLLFGMDLVHQEDLAAGHVSVEVKKTFGNNGVVLSQNAAVSTEQEGSRWLVADGDRTYTVRREGTGLRVYNERVQEDALFGLADDYVEIVRVGLASNPNTPSRVLRKLAEDVSRAVRRKVGGNPNAEPDVLDPLSHDAERDVRLAVARNPRTPLRVMERFSVSSDEPFRVATAGNRGTSPAILLGMIFDSSRDVRKTAAAHAAMPASGLIRLAEDADPEVRRAVAGNPNTSPEALRRLSFDRDRQIRTAARTRLAEVLRRQIAEDRER